MKTKQKTTANKPIAPINPREPLTNKAKRAIETYAIHRCDGLHFYPLLIKYVLEAERMKRIKLYEWLEDHGYEWKNSVQWVKGS